MLNKNQSNKRNYWKYLFVLPLLGAFVFFFQVKVVAQEKEPASTAVENAKSVENSADVYKINKNTTNAELNEKTKALKENYAIIATFSSMERNSKNELTAIKVDLKKGNKITKKIEFKGTEAIKTFGIIVSKNENGKLSADFMWDVTIVDNNDMLISPDAPSVSIEKEIFIDGTKVSQEDLDKLDQNEIESIDVNKNSEKGIIRIVTKKFYKTINDNDVYINDEKADNDELLLLDQNTITKMDINKNEKTIRITTKTIQQSADNLTIPTPPTPPVAPIPPTPPVEKNATNQDKSEIESTGNEIVSSKLQWLETYKVMMKARFIIEKIKTQKEQAKVEIEKARTSLMKSILFS